MYVYLIQQGDTGMVKIGVAVDPRSRLSSLQTGNPYPLTLKGVIPCQSSEAAYSLEGHLHERLKDHAVNGEWFAPTADVSTALDWLFAPYSNGHQRHNRSRQSGVEHLAYKAELCREYFKAHPGHLKKSGRWLEGNATPQGVTISYKTWNTVKKELTG